MDRRLLTGDRGGHALDVPQPTSFPRWIEPNEIPTPQPSLLDLWYTALKRKWYIMGTLLIVLTLAAIISLRATPIYEAVGRIAVFRENSDPLGLNKNEGVSDDWDYNVALDTQLRIIKSQTVAVEAAKKALRSKPTASPQEQRDMTNRLRVGLSAAVLPRTRIIELRFDDPDPKFAMNAINLMIDTYVEQNIKTKVEATVQTSDWLTRQLAELQLKMETAQEKLVRYQKENGILGLDEKNNIITSKLDELNKELTAAQADRIRKEADYRQAAGGAVPESSSKGEGGLLSQLRSRQAELQLQYAQISIQFGPSYPKVAELRNQLAQIQTEIEKETRHMAVHSQSEYLAAQRREQMLRTALEAQKSQANELNEKAIQFGILKHEADSNRQLYESMLQKLKEASLTAGLRSSNIRLVDSAQLPSRPVKPNIPRNMLLALILGLGLGCCVAFTMEVLDNTVNNPDDAQRIAGLPSLGLVPLGRVEQLRTHKVLPQLRGATAARLQNMELVSHARPQSQMAEAYRAIRTSILLSSTTPPKVILVTSALPKEGKTVTSINTAIVLAQKDQKVLLIDCDMRRPSVARSLGVSGRAGLSSVLTGRELLESAILRHPQLPNLSVLPSGPVPPQPSELLASNQMRELLKACRERFDHIVIDTPPVLSVTDAVILSVQVDSVILVLRSGHTTKQALRRAREVLTQVGAPTAGLVLNAVDLDAPEHYYYYYGQYKPYYRSENAE